MTEKQKKTEKPAAVEKPVELTGAKKVAAEIAAQLAAVAARYEFLPDEKTEFGEVPVGEIVVVDNFDSRATPPPPDGAFIESLKHPDGTPNLIEPVVLAWAKDKENKGAKVRIMVAGRQRLGGFKELGFKTIESVTRGMTLLNALSDTGTENMKRRALGAWDKAVFYQRLVAAGMAQKDIALRYGVSNSNVSQTLSILGLDERVAKMARTNKFGPGSDTICRELAKIDDPDTQHAVAEAAIKDPEHIWAASDVQAYVKELNDKEAARLKKKAEKEKEKKRLAKEAKARGENVTEETEETEEEDEGPAYQFDREEFEPIEIAPLHQFMEHTYGQLQRLQKKNPDLKAQVAEVKGKYAAVLKWAEAQGELKALKSVAGLSDLPAAVTKAVEAESTAE